MLDFPLLILIPLLPLAACVLTALLGPRFLKQQSHLLCIGAAIGSCLISIWLLATVSRAGAHAAHSYYNWIQIAEGHPDAVDIGFRLQADGLTSVMLTMITFVGTLIAVYSVGYMHGDEGYPRFFAVFALFLFSMTGLVLANNFVILYAFWEGVGLCSYLLIGFWFNKPAAAAAARKAFLVTRLGDVGLLLGILLIWFTYLGQLDFEYVFHNAHAVPASTLTIICLLLFCGAVGKSAQFPLHVWLPDAMEGPTPVSALIHAATMVTAGVYLVARCTPLFVLAPTAQAVVALIGGVTALLAALIALTQNDLKRVLAYSTISQLGYMFMALGSATAATSRALVGVAATAAIFHLFTHAFYKALLFLGAGSVMHAMGNVIDMRRFSGLRKVMPTTHWTFLCGALSLAGFPLFAGFWSKDEILSTTLAASKGGHTYSSLYLILFLSGLLTAGLTAFYTFRAYFKTFWGPEKIPHEAGHHAHESPRVMTVPLMILAVCAVGIGFVNAEPFTHLFHDHLERIPLVREVALEMGEEVAVSKPLVMSLSIAMALGGIGMAYLFYRKRPELAPELARRYQGLYQLSFNKFHFDEIYYFFIVRPVLALAEASRIGDLYLVDKIVDLIGTAPMMVGRAFRPIQNGLVQFYGLAMAMGAAGFLIALMWRYAW